MALNPLCLLHSVFPVCHLFLSGAVGHLVHVEPFVWVAEVFAIRRKDWANQLAVSRKLAQMPICTVICKSSGSVEVSHTWWHVHTEWKKKALTNGWGKQRKEGCCPSILLQSNGSSKEIECSLASSKQWEEVLTSPQLVMMQALYLSVISKVVFV